MALKKKEEDVQKSEDNESVFDDVHNNDEKKVVENESKKVKKINKNEVEVKEEEVMPISAVQELLKRSEERMSNLFNSQIQKLKLDVSKNELDSSKSYIEELEDDWMETPAVFFAYSINYSIFGDNKLGKQSVPPNGAVKFKPIIRTKRQTRKGEEVISVSSVKVNSKSVATWLRNHSQFGIAFFENMESALNIDSGWAQKLIEANQSINRLSDQQIISRCRQEGIPIGTDVIEMRKSLVSYIAERSIKRDDSIRYKGIKESIVKSDNKDGVERQVVERKIN